MKSFYVCENGFAAVPEWKPKCWVHITNPSADEIESIHREFNVPIEFIEDIQDVEERPRIETEDGWRLLIMRVPYKQKDSSFNTVPFGIMIKGDVFITLCYFDLEMIPDFIRYSVRKNIVPKTSMDLLLMLFLSSSVWFLKYLKQINSQIKTAEDMLEKSIRNEELHRLMRIEKWLVYFITSLRSNEILLVKLKILLKQFEGEYDPDLFEEVEIELQQAYASANIYSDILSGTMDAFASIISNNLNVIMKYLTSISIILMIPTLIASFYGMNVSNHLEENPFGFLIIVTVSLLFSIVGVLTFKRKNFF